MKTEIIYNLNDLKKCSHSGDLETNQKIAIELFKILSSNTNGHKLACNQIGITDHKVAVINVREPLYFINPDIIVYGNPIIYLSDDLSFPQKLINTEKYARIVVKAENFKKPIEFGLKNKKIKLNITDPVIMEACAIQHVVDLLNGITMYDRKIKKQETIVNQNKFYRNQIVTLIKENENPIKIKFKYASKYLNNGWKISHKN